MAQGAVAEDKKGALRKGAMIVFLDESGFSQRPTVRRTWGRRGDTPVMYEHVTWNHFSAIGALGYHPKRRQVRLFLSLRPRAVKGGDLLMFLKSLRRHVHDRVVLVLDNLPAHRSKVVAGYFEAQKSWLRVEWLPPYAPELNPLEDVWANLDTDASWPTSCPTTCSSWSARWAGVPAASDATRNSSGASSNTLNSSVTATFP